MNRTPFINVVRQGQHTLPLPTRGSAGAAGYDVRSTQALTIQPGEQVAIPTGFAWEIPPGWCGMVCPRSGLAIRHRLDKRAGLIDEDFRGELVVVLVNEHLQTFEVKPGERIAQMVIVPCLQADIVELDAFESGTARGVGGFGSTGTH